MGTFAAFRANTSVRDRYAKIVGGWHWWSDPRLALTVNELIDVTREALLASTSEIA